MRKFHFTSICNALPCELRLFWNSTGVLNRHLADKLPTCYQQSADSRLTNGQQSADCWQKIFVKGGKQQLADSRPTVDQQSADSFLGELFFIFSHCCASHWGIISIYELAANSGSPWILQAPNLHFRDAVVNWC